VTLIEDARKNKKIIIYIVHCSAATSQKNSGSTLDQLGSVSGLSMELGLSEGAP